jgi:glycosyltransferase involved in cell wall biosynthesis
MEPRQLSREPKSFISCLLCSHFFLYSGKIDVKQYAFEKSQKCVNPCSKIRTVQRRRASGSMVKIGAVVGIIIVIFVFFSGQKHDPRVCCNTTRPSIMLCTSELEHLTAGGAGVVVADTARALAQAGWRVLIAADILELDDTAIESWLSRAQTAWARRGGDASTALDLSLRTLSELAGFPEVGSSRNVSSAGVHTLWTRNSQNWARAVQRVGHGFDLIEFWDYGGPAYYTLLQRLDGHGSNRVAGRDRGHGDIRLPQIVIRTHGLHQVIHAIEGHKSTPSLNGANAFDLLFRIETRALQLADAVIANSPGIARTYKWAHNLDQRRMLTIAPTLGTLTNPSRTKYERTHSMPQHHLLATWGVNYSILVYGKLQRVKGPDVAARALVRVMRDLASEWRGSAIFVGDDEACDVDRRSRMSTCIIATEVPRDLRSRFRFVGRIKRGAVGKFASDNRARLIILASRYETFCLAAHEAAFFGLPIVISRLPAYEGYFVDGKNAFTFAPGSSCDLARVVKAAILDEARVSRVARRANHINYPDPSAQYLRLV